MGGLLSHPTPNQYRGADNMKKMNKYKLMKELKEYMMSAMLGLGMLAIFGFGLWLECKRYVNDW